MLASVHPGDHSVWPHTLYIDTQQNRLQNYWGNDHPAPCHGACHKDVIIGAVWSITPRPASCWRPKKCYKDQLKTVLKKCKIKPGTWSTWLLTATPGAQGCTPVTPPPHSRVASAIGFLGPGKDFSAIGKLIAKGQQVHQHQIWWTTISILKLLPTYSSSFMSCKQCCHGEIQGLYYFQHSLSFSWASQKRRSLLCPFDLAHKGSAESDAVQIGCTKNYFSNRKTSLNNEEVFLCKLTLPKKIIQNSSHLFWSSVCGLQGQGS